MEIQLVSVLLVIAYLEEGAKNTLPGGKRPDPLRCALSVLLPSSVLSLPPSLSVSFSGGSVNLSHIVGRLCPLTSERRKRGLVASVAGWDGAVVAGCQA